MSRAQDLLNDGYKNYKAGEYRVAALCWAEAATAAAAGHDIALQYEALVWQAVALAEIGEITRALGRFLAAYEIESDHPEADFPWHEQWLRREKMVEIQIASARPVTEIRAALTDATEFSATHRIPPHDIAVLQGDILYGQGQWAAALSQYGTARAQYYTNGAGYTQCGFAHAAVLCCLRLQRWSAAADWIAAIRQEEEWQRGWVDVISLIQAMAQFDLARAHGAEHSHLKSLFQATEAVSTSLDELAQERRLARMALALLDPDGGDPAHGGHPARRALYRRPDSRENVHDVFDYVRAILDYRLACLRFAATIAAVDDEYQQAPPPSCLHIAHKQDFLYRLKRVRVVLAAARRRARAIDTAFECDWRQHDIDRRADAIDAIARASAEEN